jgi:glutathione S-transferase
MKLYYSPGTCSIAAHIALEHIGVPFTPIRTAILDGATNAPEYIAINPQGRVPVLQVGEQTITELPAILLVLDRLFPQARLLPAEPLAQAPLLSLMAFLSSNVHIAFAHFWRPERFSDDPALAAPLAAFAKRDLMKLLAMVEARLPTHGYCGGEQMSIADMNLLPFYRFGLRVGLEMRTFSRYTALLTRAMEERSVQRVVAREGIGSLLPTAS